MDNYHPLSTLIAVSNLDPEKDQFRLMELEEEILRLEVPYLNAIGVDVLGTVY